MNGHGPYSPHGPLARVNGLAHILPVFVGHHRHRVGQLTILTSGGQAAERDLIVGLRNDVFSVLVEAVHRAAKVRRCRHSISSLLTTRCPAASATLSTVFFAVGSAAITRTLLCQARVSLRHYQRQRMGGPNSVGKLDQVNP